MIPFFILFAVLIAGGIIFYSYYSSDANFAAAIAHYENNEDDKAVEMLKSYIIAKPKDPRPKLYLAKIYFKKKEYIPALKECISITVNNYSTLHEKAEAYCLICEMYIEQNLLEKAGKAAIEGLKLEPRNHLIHYQLGKLYFITDKFDKASREFNFVLTIDRGHIESRLFMSKIHEKQRDETKAIFQYKRILEIDPNNREARFSLAVLYYNKGELQTAVEELEQIKDLSGIEFDYYYMLSSYYIKIKDRQKAKEIIEKIAYTEVSKNEKLTFMRYELAVILEEDGELEKALELYEKIKIDIPRYKDVDQRMQRIRKTLYPEEHAKIVDKIDYNSLSNIEFEEMMAKVINKLGFKEMKVLHKTRNSIMMVCVEKFKTLLQGKYLIQMLRSFDKTGDIEVAKFIDKVRDEQAVKGIMISTSTYTDSAVIMTEKMDNIELLDKLNIFELMT